MMIMVCVLQMPWRLGYYRELFLKILGGCSSDIVLDSSMLSRALRRRLSLS
jgi:hypothetical protein